MMVMEETCRYRIGLDISEDLNKVEITVLKGLNTVLNTVLEDYSKLTDIIPLIISICNKYDARIVFENNRKSIYLAFKETGNLDYLETCYKLNMLTNNYEPVKGICYNLRYKILWEDFEFLFNYNKEYEDSTRIAALSLLTDLKHANNIFNLQKHIKLVEIYKQNLELW